MFHRLPDAQFIGEHVGCSRGQNAQGNVRVDHAVNGLVDGAIAASHQNQIGSTINGPARDFAGVTRSRGGNGIDSDPARVQQLDGPSKRMLSPSESARVRIINENSLPVALDSTLIIVDARQQGRGKKDSRRDRRSPAKSCIITSTCTTSWISPRSATPNTTG